MKEQKEQVFLTADDLEQAAGKSLVDWANPPSVSDLKQDLQGASSSQAMQAVKIREWLDNLNVEGKAKPKAIKGKSSVVPRLIRKQAEWRYAALSEPFLSNEELFKVSPITWEDKKSAEHNQLILAKQFETDINKTAFIDEYVRTAVDEGTAILRVGWEFQEKEVTKEVPTIELVPSPEAVELLEELSFMQADSPAEYEESVPEELKVAHMHYMESGIPVMPNILGYETVKVMETVINRPTVEVCSYNNVTIDPTCNGDMSKAQFAVYSFESDLATLRKDNRYKNLDKIVPSESALSMDDSIVNDQGDFTFKDKPRKKVMVYEYWGYWDIYNDGMVVPIVATWVGATMIRLEENPYPDKQIPFIVVQYLPVRKSVYGEPDGALLVENQQVAGAVLRGMIDLMGKSANSQTGFQKGILDPMNRRRYEAGLDYEYNGSANIEAAIRMHKYPEIPVSAQYMLDLQSIEAESLTGVKSFSQGMSQSSLGNVATSVRGVLDAASKREVGILRRLSDGIVQVGKKFISMNAEFLSDKEVIRITNEQYEVIYRDSLAGDFDLKLSISTPEQDETKAQELAFMLQTLGNNMDFGITKLVIADIAKLRKMPDLAKKIMDFEPQPDPMAEMMAQMELQMMQAKLEAEMAKAEYYRTYANLNMGRTDTELYKQADMQTEIDQKNLDFVEQESGVKQARELELRSEQAKSQAELAKMTHSLKEQSNQRDRLMEYLKTRNV